MAVTGFFLGGGGVGVGSWRWQNAVGTKIFYKYRKWLILVIFPSEGETPRGGGEMPRCLPLVPPLDINQTINERISKQEANLLMSYDGYSATSAVVTPL